MAALKPICVKCACFYRPEKNGFPFIEAMPIGTAEHGPAPRGNEAPERWKPYKLWLGDLWQCPECAHQIVVGALNPYAEHFEHNFAAKVAQCKPTLTVNDC